jgi:hypothetical protein
MNGAWRWLASAAVLLAVIAAPVYSWYVASDYSDLGTLRWCVVTKALLIGGSRVKDEDVGLTIRRVKANDTCVADVRRAVGKYATKDLRVDELMTPSHLSEFVPVRVPVNGAAVPVEVKTEHSGSVRPGTRLVFVQEKDKAIKMIPAAKDKGAKRKWHGFKVISVVVSAKDASITTLTVAVQQADVSLIPALATGQWRPVILGLQ